MDTEHLYQMPVDELEPDTNVRQGESDEQVESLAISICEYGVIQPIGVRLDGIRKLIVFGKNRWLAAKRAGKKFIPARIIEGTLSPSDRTLLQLVENLQ